MLKSLRLRLLIILFLILSISSSLATFYSYHEAQHEIQELFDAQLAQEARIIYSGFLVSSISSNYHQLQKTLEQNARLIPALSNSVRENDDLNSTLGHIYERKIAFQIWDHQQRLVLRSVSAPQETLAPMGLSQEGRGYHDVMLSGKKWRVFSLWNKENQYIIQTGEEYDIRDELAREVSRNWILTTGLTLPLIILMVMLAVHYGFAPLGNIVRQIRRRNPQHLRPIITDNVPSEVQPLLDELNLLFSRVSTTLERERRFTDDAAHELRTPLAALKTQAQVALRSQDNKERNTAILHLIKSVDRLTHLVQQLLNLARLGAGEVRPQLSPVDLYHFTAELFSQLAPMALEKQLELELLEPAGDEHTVMAETSILTMLLRNIIDNAIRYTPPNGKISIQLSKKAMTSYLCITDTGPGIPAEFSDRIYDRFFRITGSGESGCGLGLAIAKQCAELLEVEMSMENVKNGSGLRVCLTFKQAPVSD